MCRWTGRNAMRSMSIGMVTWYQSWDDAFKLPMKLSGTLLDWSKYLVHSDDVWLISWSIMMINSHFLSLAHWNWLFQQIQSLFSLSVYELLSYLKTFVVQVMRSHWLLMVSSIHRCIPFGYVYSYIDAFRWWIQMLSDEPLTIHHCQQHTEIIRCCIFFSIRRIPQGCF